MSLNHIAFRGVIEARAEALGRETSQQRVEALEAVLQSLGRHDVETNTLTIEETEGQPVDLFAYLDQAVASFPARPAPEPEPVASDAWVKVSIGGGTGWRKANDPMLAILRGLQASDDAALARDVATMANPWLPGQINRTNQVLIAKSDPALAARFKKEAGTAA